jgi:hypothetical protein
VYDLLPAIRNEALPMPNFEDGVATQSVLYAIERSNASGQWERVSR